AYRRPGTDIGRILDATHYGSAIRQWQFCLLHHDAFFANLRNGGHARQHVRRRRGAPWRAQPQWQSRELRREDLPRHLLPGPKGPPGGPGSARWRARPAEAKSLARGPLLYLAV